MALRRVATQSPLWRRARRALSLPALGETVRVLVACEFSGIVRDAFRVRGHDAWSCDLLPSERATEYHYQGDALYFLRGRQSWTGHRFDLLLAFPPCTHLAVSGARWFQNKKREQFESLRFVADLLDADVPHIALENPIGVISTIHPRTRPDHPALAIRARRNQGDLPLAQEPAKSGAHEHRAGTRRPRVEGAAGTGSLEESQPNLPGHS